MVNTFVKIWCLAGLAFMVMLTSCLHPAIHQRKQITLMVEAQSFMERGEYKSALHAYRIAFEQKNNNVELQRKYSQAMEKVKMAADSSYEQEDFAGSGNLYCLLSENYLNIEGQNGSLSFKKEWLSKRIIECSSRLTKKGLEYYRKGDLKKAIAVWQSILEFDPQNPEIQKAIETASIQKKNLQEIRK